MNLRPAESNDFDSLFEIYQENHIGSGGQLVGDFFPSDCTYVAEVDNEIVAYVNILEHLPARVTDETQIIDPAYCFGQSTLYIKQIAVKKTHQNKGMGKQIYRALRELYPDAILYAFVDIRNSQSMRFHLRSSFLPIGVFEVSQFYTTANYTAFLLATKDTAKVS